MLFRKCNYLAEPVQVHARYHNGDEQHADAELLAVFDSLQLYIQHVPAAYRVVYLIIHAVELEVYQVEPCLLQLTQIVYILRDADTV